MAVVCGGSHTCAIRSDTQVVCWGANDKGQLGIGNTRVNVGKQSGQMGDYLKSVDFGLGIFEHGIVLFLS